MRVSHEDIALAGLGGEIDLPWPGEPIARPPGSIEPGVALDIAFGPLLQRVFDALREEWIRYCVLRNREESVGVLRRSRLDVLVHPGDLERLTGLVVSLGFVLLPSRGRRRLLLAYDGEEDLWWRLDVATPAAFGRPGSALGDLARNCLARRRFEPPCFVPSPEDELVATLLRCALDPAPISPARCHQLQRLALRVRDPAHLEVLLDRLWIPRTEVRVLLRQIGEGEWPLLLARAGEVARRLSPHPSLRTRLRGAIGRLLGSLHDRFAKVVPGAPVVAVVASGGPGATTLGAALREHLYGDARLIAMELGAGGADRASPAALPLRLVGFGLWALEARWHRSRGRFVILDRYPFAAPTGDDTPPWRQRLLHFALARIGPRPDLVLIPGSPGAGSEAPSEPEPRPETGRPHLRTRCTESARLDADGDPERLRREALACVWTALHRRSRTVPPGRHGPSLARGAQGFLERVG